ncbi:glucose dehydrogenase B [gamma proteobacterium HTCC5015]|nr:glucose dehydrogenase B [gamma proteobacterium HTCC5015]
MTLSLFIPLKSPPFIGLFLVLLASAACSQTEDFNRAPPNAPHQEPAFEGQTRAPVLKDSTTLAQETLTDGLVHPWGMAQLPDGRWLVTERLGRLRLVSTTGELSPPLEGLPTVDARGQGGLLDVAIWKDFPKTRQIWWSYAEPRGAAGNATAVATGTLSQDERRIENARVIFQQQPAWPSTAHFGSRLVFDHKGQLFITTGDRSQPKSRQLAQDTSTHIGKILRIKPQGGAADGNPDIEGGQPEIWSFGHRNVQSAALGPDGALWTAEHGPRGGDELNRPQAGRNYGWPIITYGEEYSGQPVGEGLTAKHGMEQPVYYWDPVIAPSDMVFYQGDLFSDWQGDLLIGGLASRALVRLKIKDQRVIGEARYLQGQARIRDVDVDQNGAIVILTDAQNGALIRLTPAD